MQRCFVLVVVLFLGLLSACVAAANPVKAFPTAEGYGANAVGGRGGRAIEVTNLNDSGPGSLRACVEDTGPRTCVFRVAGTIALQSNLSILEQNSYLTIAGQTAPGDGVQLRNHVFYISNGAHDIIIRFLRIRSGIDYPVWDPLGILVYTGGTSGPPINNVIIDHSEVYWGCHENLNFTGNLTNFTMQWSISGEPMDRFDQGGGCTGLNMILISYGGQGPMTMSFHHNLFTDTAGRNPNLSGGLGGSVVTVDWRNNIHYNTDQCTPDSIGLPVPQPGSGADGPANILLDFVGNKYISGPGSPPECYLGRVGGAGGTRIYVQDNWTPRCANNCASGTEWELGWEDARYGYGAPVSQAEFRAYSPHNTAYVNTTPLSQLEAVIAANVGATKPVRDSLTTKTINEFVSRTGDKGRDGEPWPTLASGIPPQDSDRDGMPDAWETSHGLNPNNRADGAATAANGYTNLENYLNELAGDPVPAGSLPAPTKLRIVVR